MKPIPLTGTEAAQGKDLTSVARVIKPQPDTSKWKPEYINKPKEWRRMVQLGPVHHGYDPDIWVLHDVGDSASDVGYTSRKAPYAVGDIVYVKEPISIGFGGCGKELGTQFRYINNPEDEMRTVHVSYPYSHSYRSARNMPRYAARYFYEITGVSVEQRDGNWYWLYKLKGIEK